VCPAEDEHLTFPCKTGLARSSPEQPSSAPPLAEEFDRRKRELHEERGEGGDVRVVERHREE
jgi:hypothetical protein